MYSMSRSDHIPPHQALPAAHRLIHKYNNAAATLSSQSESNIPGMEGYSPTNFKPYTHLGSTITQPHLYHASNKLYFRT